jgi:hypothetical protein
LPTDNVPVLPNRDWQGGTAVYCHWPAAQRWMWRSSIKPTGAAAVAAGGPGLGVGFVQLQSQGEAAPASRGIACWKNFGAILHAAATGRPRVCGGGMHVQQAVTAGDSW